MGEISIYPVAIQRFFAESPNLRSRDTRTSYARVLRALQARYPAKCLSDFEAEDVVEFLLFEPDGDPRHWSPNTLATYRTALLSFFEWAMEYGHVTQPISVVLKRRVRIDSTNSLRPHSWLREQEVRALLSTCDGTPRGQRDHALLGLGLLCGLRLEELRTLRWSDVNLEGRMISLVGKGAKPAYVGLSDHFVHFLLDWMRVCAAQASADFGSRPVVPRGWYGGGPTTHTEGIYHIEWTRPMSRSTIEKTVRMRGALIGHPELTPHDLRRSCAGLLEAKGVPIQDISRFLRHSNVAVTQRYLLESPHKVVETATMLAGLG